MLDQQIQKKLRHCDSLPSPPKVAQRIIAISQDDAAGAKEVAEAVKHDPGLVTKILQLVNSPAYFRGRPVENLSQAVVFLGLNTMLNLALSLSLVASMRKRPAGHMDIQLYWRRSIIAATSARALSDYMGVPPTEVENFFLAGLLQDVGMLALNETEPALYSSIDQLSHQSVENIERDILRSDHPSVGAWLLKRWNLPEYIRLAVGGSHDPASIDVPQEHERIVACTAVSGSFADIWLAQGSEESCAHATKRAEDLLGLSQLESWVIIQAMAENLIETSTLFGIDIGEPTLLDATLSECESVLAA